LRAGEGGQQAEHTAIFRDAEYLLYVERHPAGACARAWLARPGTEFQNFAVMSDHTKSLLLSGSGGSVEVM
jgi:hypothetical protein